VKCPDCYSPRNGERVMNKLISKITRWMVCQDDGVDGLLDGGVDSLLDNKDDILEYLTIYEGFTLPNLKPLTW